MQLKPKLISQIHSIIATAKDRAIPSDDTERVQMYSQIGKVIFEEEQVGKKACRLWRIFNKVYIN